MIRMWITFNCTCQPKKKLHQTDLTFQSKPCPHVWGSACSSTPDLSVTALKYLLGKGTEKDLGTVPQTAEDSGDILSLHFRRFKMPLSSEILCQEQQQTSCFDTEQLPGYLVHLQGGKMSQHSHGQSGIIFRLLWRNSFSPCIQHNIQEQSIDIVRNPQL